ncbi:hypothetical protein EVAR_57237_1 [Eumeta japonica]|uniref:Uncharacterized protein n=1 Tax=Eumeta variegata TaxID=151549 RepID=A0A4C1ZID5_EUMVA|nr:hypothetical protein EVAR_57237_1 [Eumeta japonica]
MRARVSNHAAHRHLQPQRDHQCVVDLMGNNGISGGRVCRWRGSGTPELTVIGRNVTAEAATSCLCSVKVWYRTGRVNTFSCCTQISHFIALIQLKCSKFNRDVLHKTDKTWVHI